MIKYIAATAVLALAAATAPGAFAQNNNGGDQGGQGNSAGANTNMRFLNEQSQGGGAQVFISPAGVRLVQLALNREGYNAGNLDGAFGKETGAALSDFQKANNLEPTGTLTIPTLNCLGLSNVVTGSYAANTRGNGAVGPNDMRYLNEQATNQGAPLMYSPAQIRIVQQAINREGYNAGNITGAAPSNDQTYANALRNFQQAHNLNPDGKLTVSVITALGANRATFTTSCPGGGNGGSATNQRFINEQANGGGGPVYLSGATIRMIKQALNADGFNAGNLNGNDDQQMQAAISNYEKAHNLAPTGTITTAFLTDIGMSHWYAGQTLNWNPAQAMRNGGQGVESRAAYEGGNGAGGNMNNGGNGGAMRNGGGGNGGGVNGAGNGQAMNGGGGNGGAMNNGGGDGQGGNGNGASGGGNAARNGG